MIKLYPTRPVELYFVPVPDSTRRVTVKPVNAVPAFNRLDTGPVTFSLLIWRFGRHDIK